MKYLLLIFSTVLILHATKSFAMVFPPALLPQTGQTTCYDAAGTNIDCSGTGQDGEFQNGMQWPIPRFVDNGDQTQTDKLTGLMWSKSANIGPRTWQGALDLINTINSSNYLGYNNWRLPKINELISIVNQGQTPATWLTTQGFLAVKSSQADYYWSSSTYATSTTYALFVNVGDGNMNGYGKTTVGGYVWLVRAGQSGSFDSLVLSKTGQTTCFDASGAAIACSGTGQDGELQTGASWPTPRFVDNGDQTQTDKLTGLVWSKNANPAAATKNWQSALDYIKALNSSNYLGYSDWSLPNVNELKSLVNQGQSSVTWLNGQGFSSVQSSNVYWSSSSYASNVTTAWGVGMEGGFVGNGYKSSYDGYVWPVRAKQFWSFNTLILSAMPKFGSVHMDTLPPIREIEIGNLGSTSQSITSINLSGTNATEFSITIGGSNQCESTSPTLAPGASCTLMLGFTPTSSGSKTASLDITVNGVTKNIPLSGTAINTVYGTVTDQATGLAVSGATVTLNTAATATTNTDGSYTFGDLPAATYSITVSKTGYQTTSKTGLVVTATTSAKADILLPTVSALNITSTTLPWASPNVPYSNRVKVAGGTAPYAFSKPTGTLPTGLSLDTATGIISGTPTGSGISTFAIGVTDTVLGYAEKEFTIELLAPLQITTFTLPSGQQGIAYSSSIAGTGGKTAYGFTLIEGTLPSGITLSTSGTLSGTPREAGTFNIRVKLTDSTGITTDKPFTLTLAAADVLALNTTTLSQGYIGTSYSTTLSASGGVPARTFSVTGTLPTGLSLNSSTGKISGTPSVAGLTNLTFTVTDYSYPTAQTASVTLPIRIWSPLAISTTTLPAGTQKTAYNSSLNSTGGAAPHSWSIFTGTLPQGITLDSTTGAISGTPTNCGAFPVTARLTDSAATPKNVDKALTLTVACSNDYIISGTTGVAGATVTYSGAASGSVTADGSGNFSIGPLLNGIYTVTPSKPLYIFTPTSQSATVNNLDLTVAAFTGSLDTTAPTITGFAIPATSTTLAVSVTTFTATDNAPVTGYVLTESATAPTTATTGWSATTPSSYTFAGIPVGVATTKTLYAWAKDEAGNISAGTAATTIITLPDVIKPEITAFTIPATSDSLTVAVSTLAVSGNTAVTGYLLSETSSQPQSNDAGWTATLPTQYVFTSQGTKTIYAFAKDAAGNISVPLSATVTITLADTTAPVVTTFTVPATATSLTVPITALVATDAVGVSSYLINESSTEPQSNAQGWSTTLPTQYIFTSQGAKTLYAFAKDAAGNISAPRSATVTITLPDTVAPSVSLFTLPATATSLTVPITTLTASDAAGVTGYLLKEAATVPLSNDPAWSATVPAQYAFTSQGTKTIYVFAKDAAGNISAPLSGTVTITLADTTAPVVTAFTLPATDSSLIVPVSSFSATDAAGVTGYYLGETSTAPALIDTHWTTTPTSSYTFATAGTKTLYAFAKDAAGNISTPVSAIVTITLADTTAPIVTVFTMPTTSTSLTVSVTTFTANDNTAVTGYILSESATTPLPTISGWTSTAPSAYSFSTAGSKTLYAFAKDAAGNVSVPGTANITITLPDATAPEVTTFVIPATSGSLTVPVTTFSATDNVAVTGYLLSESSSAPSLAAQGWASTAQGSYTFSSIGSKTLYTFTKDAAGNISASASASVVITTATPATYTITPTTGTTYTITPATPQAVTNTAATTFTVTPANGYGVVVSGCGGSLNGTAYTTAAITANCTISVTAVARNAGSGGVAQPPTINDALKVLQAVVGITPLSAAEQIRYDVAPLGSSGKPEGNGVLDAADVILILRRSIGIGSW
jgi:hypothetical protein